MRRIGIIIVLIATTFLACWAQDSWALLRLVRMPLKSIGVEYPNKTGQIINDEADARLTPSELHPVFYGSFDWHSSVHSHWMLVHTLRISPEISLRDSILSALDNSFEEDKLKLEAAYFDRPGGAAFERTYGWAWLLKLDEELFHLSRESASNLSEKAAVWRSRMQPLTNVIVSHWKTYLSKMTYADRIGTHGNSAFALGFALDWARAVGARDFEEQLKQRALALYRSDHKIPAEWEPNATDFFSPSLMEADLMRRIMPVGAYRAWLKQFFSSQGLRNLCVPPTVSDLKDYHIVHLVGLSFSRAWCMASIAKALPDNDHIGQRLRKAATLHYEQGMSQIFQSNYGGDHWLGTFAAYAAEQMRVEITVAKD